MVAGWECWLDYVLRPGRDGQGDSREREFLQAVSLLGLKLLSVSSSNEISWLISTRVPSLFLTRRSGLEHTVAGIMYTPANQSAKMESKCGCARAWKYSQCKKRNRITLDVPSMPRPKLGLCGQVS